MTRKGRKVFIDPIKRDKFLAALAAGVHVEPAAALAGFARTSVFEWLQRGRADIANCTDLYPTERAFAQDVDRVLAVLEAQLVREIIKCGKGDGDPRRWKAAAWILEKRFRNRWAPKVEGEIQATEIVVDIGGK